MGASNTGYIMTLANSIIGVGILAMPFCFQKCGIILSILMLILSHFITRLCCHYLLKTSILHRKRTFEFLAFHIFGSSGKLMVELCVIGYLMGTCITYFVVLGDLGPQITAKLFNLNLSDTLRTWVMIIVTIVCIIPLGLLKNIESLSHVCTTSIIFYFCMVVKVIAESEQHIISNDWYDNVSFWKPSGILQCLPILTMAMSCQTNLFEVYESLPNPSLQKMNEIVKSATALCTGVYVLVGFFGYVAFSSQAFSGNIMLQFSPSVASDIITMGFVLSVACSFPLVIFPCRASLYSLLYRRSYTEAAHYIPEHRFKYITISMILTSLLVGIMIPSIELIIGLVGSTIGVGICLMFPAACFVKSIKKNSTERLLAQTIIIFGFIIMILGTYANLNAIDEKKSGTDIEKPIVHADLPQAIHPNDIPDIPSDLNEIVLKPLPDPDKGVENKIAEPPHTFEQKLPIEIPQISDKVEPIVEINLLPVVKKGQPAQEQLLSPNNEPKIDIKPIGPVDRPVIPEAKPTAATKPDSVINKDAIQKEDQEIAIADKEDAGKELKQTKQLLEQVKDELEKQNKETQKIVMDKIEKISQKVDKIGHVKDAAVKDSAAAHGSVKTGEPNTVVKLLLDNKSNLINNSVYKTEGKSSEDMRLPVNGGAVQAPSSQEMPVRPSPPSEIHNLKADPTVEVKRSREIVRPETAAVKPSAAESFKVKAGEINPPILHLAEPNGPISQIQNKPVASSEHNDAALRDLLSVEVDSAESPHHREVRSVEQEKQHIDNAPQHAAGAEPLPLVKTNKEAEQVLHAGTAQSNHILPAKSIDPKVFVRELKSINDTQAGMTTTISTQQQQKHKTDT